MASSPPFAQNGGIALNSDLEESNCEVEFASRSFAAAGAGDDDGSSRRRPGKAETGQAGIQTAPPTGTGTGNVQELQQQQQQHQQSPPPVVGARGDTATTTTTTTSSSSSSPATFRLLEDSPTTSSTTTLRRRVRLPNRVIDNERVVDLTGRVRLGGAAAAGDPSASAGGHAGKMMGELLEEEGRDDYDKSARIGRFASNCLGLSVEAAVIGVLFYLLLYKT